MALSGGERRRCEIARALAANPSIMLLDEPFAGIDPISIGDIRDLVRDLKQRDIGVLITDHNVRETLDIVDRACIIYGGQVLFAGTPAGAGRRRERAPALPRRELRAVACERDGHGTGSAPRPPPVSQSLVMTPAAAAGDQAAGAVEPRDRSLHRRGAGQEPAARGAASDGGASEGVASARTARPATRRPTPSGSDELIGALGGDRRPPLDIDWREAALDTDSFADVGGGGGERRGVRLRPARAPATPALCRASARPAARQPAATVGERRRGDRPRARRDRLSRHAAAR